MLDLVPVICSMNLNCGDVQNTLQKLERSSRKIGMSTNTYPLLASGDPSHCLEFAKHLLFYVSKEVASEMISRRCTEQSPDKRIVLSFFDILREKSKASPPISAEQFLNNGFVEHKLLILIKLVVYVSAYCKIATSPSFNRASRSNNSSASNTPNGKASSMLNTTPLRVGIFGVSSVTPPEKVLEHSRISSQNNLIHNAIGNSSDMTVEENAYESNSGINHDLRVGEVTYNIDNESETTIVVNDRRSKFNKAATTGKPIGTSNMDNAQFSTECYLSEGGTNIVSKICEEVMAQKIANVNQQMLIMAQVRWLWKLYSYVLIFAICHVCFQEFDASLTRLSQQVDAKLSILDSRLSMLEQSDAGDKNKNKASI